ncbi:hypothetical protein Tco_0799796 [Tanacetum coccineum]|uniref:Uncharacterized protein n=1 Tax=Tanacetum coccineum TaxID=301880 RepID=A0ABQ4ZVR1_9ASTR
MITLGSEAARAEPSQAAKALPQDPEPTQAFFCYFLRFVDLPTLVYNAIDIVLLLRLLLRMEIEWKD